ncbi:MAG: tetratricopeptide repeat protein, partial [Bacteroidota bacterium]|nr:tetratricopeptide repeat protein [Bacteroidota bacterium]
MNFYAPMWLKKYCLSCILCLLSFVSFSQNIDSLKLALKNAKHDTTRCNILATLAETASDEEWPKYNEQLLKLSESKIKLTQKSSIDYKIYLLHYAGALNNIGVIYNNQRDIPKALEYNSKSLKIREEIGDKSGIATSLNNIGVIYDKQGDIPKALEYYSKSLKIYEDIGDKKGIATSLNNIGYIYENLGDIPKALENYDKSLKIYEEIGDKEGIAYYLNNIGYIYKNQGDIPTTLEYYSKSLKIREEIGDKEGIATSLNNIGFIYSIQGDPSITSSKEDALRAGIPKALEYYSKSLKIQEEIGDKEGIATSLNNIGFIYKIQGDPSITSSKEDALRAGIPKALEYYSKSLKIYEEIGDKEGIATSLNNIGFIYNSQGNLKEGFTYAKRSMDVAKELGFPENIKNSAHTIKTIYQKQKKYKEAFEMYELEIKMRDSITNQETQKAAIKKQLQYTYEKKELETKAEQDKKDTIAKAELKQKVNERNYFIVGFGLVLILALFILRGYKQKQKAN